MNFQHLFTTERVVVAIYRTVSTAVLFYYLAKRIREGKAQVTHDRWRSSRRIP